MTLTAIPLEPLSATRVRVREVNEANGCWEDERPIGDCMILMSSEVAETLEAYRDRDGGFEDRTRVLCAHRRFGADYDAHDASVAAGEHLCKPEGVGSELADVMIRLLDTTDRHGIPLDAMVRARPTYDTDESFGTALMELQVQIALAYVAFTEHTAAAIYSHLLGLAIRAGVDLQAEVDRKVAFNATRGHKHGGKRL